MTRTGRGIKPLSIISANVRGFQTNVGELTHRLIIPENPDIVACVETFLNENIPENFGKVKGYSRWYRKDRVSGTYGGVAVCFKKNITFQEIKVAIPSHLELCFFKIWINSHDCLLLCVCYRPQWQGSEPIMFLKSNLDNILVENSCTNVVIVGDLNQNIISRSFNDLLDTHGLINHVNFPTHISGSSLDPVLTDMTQGAVTCRVGGTVGTSDHYAVVSSISLSALRDDPVERIFWNWEHSNWPEMKRAILNIEWDEVLSGESDLQVERFNEILSDLQSIPIIIMLLSPQISHGLVPDADTSQN